MTDKKKFYVSRWISYKQYVIVDAVDADDAMRITDSTYEELLDTDGIEVDHTRNGLPGGYNTVKEVSYEN